MKRLRPADGFGLVETVIGLTVLNVALLALVAALNSGAVALARAAENGAAGTLADEQLERYRALDFSAIALDAASVSTLDQSNNEYSCDPALAVDPAQPCSAGNRKAQTTVTCTAPLPLQCVPSRAVTGADGRPYRVDTYVVEEAPEGLANARPVRVVTVVVRDGDALSRTLVRLESSFDQSTG